MDQRLVDLQEAVGVLDTKRKECLADSPYGWEMNYKASNYLMGQVRKYFMEAA